MIKSVSKRRVAAETRNPNGIQNPARTWNRGPTQTSTTIPAGACVSLESLVRTYADARVWFMQH